MPGEALNSSGKAIHLPTGGGFAGALSYERAEVKGGERERTGR